METWSALSLENSKPRLRKIIIAILTSFPIVFTNWLSCFSPVVSFVRITKPCQHPIKTEVNAAINLQMLCL